MKPVPSRLVSLAFLTAFAGAAHATLIDFEDVTGGTDQIFYRSFGNAVASGGFDFSTTHVLSSWTPLAPLFIGGNYDGSTSLYAEDGTDTISMARSGGGSFSLAQIDLARAFLGSGGPGEFVTFVGTKSNGAQVTRKYALRENDGLQSVAFWGFSDLVSVRWNQTPSLHQFDNVRVDEIPITPGPAAAMPFALMFLRRRKRAVYAEGV